jgi:hypothetical protein
MRIFRYFVMVVAIAFLVIGLNNCGGTTPPETASSPPATTSPAASREDTSISSDPKININTAILSELDKLEAQLGIPALSHQIQASRPYGSIEDLVSKGVLTQEQFDQVQTKITVEEIVLTGEAKDIDYMTKLGLMKGHMIVAGQLLDLGLPDQAEPHLGHPVEEIYVDIADQLSERNVPEFSETLTRVQDLVKSKPDDPQVKSAYDAAMTAIDQAIEALPAAQRQSPSFTLAVMNQMLETAVAEYTASIADGKITEEIEYQDSRGFVEYAKDTLLKNIEANLASEKSGVELQAKLDDLFTAWPEPVPPETPVMSAAEVASKVKDIEMMSASF